MSRPTTAARPPVPPTSDAVLDRLNRLHPKIIDLSLGRVRRLLDRLGHPEERLAPVVHIAGTNGKGSVVAFLHAMLEAAGARVQAYTSPHLVRFHERIRLVDGPIDEAALVDLLEVCEAANGPEPITFFEITTAAAFLAFAREPADVLLLETGLGGRLDATNVVAQPHLTVITPVSIDHVQYLGEGLGKIAFEKAGILKPGVPAVVGPQADEALEVIERRAAEIGAPLYRAGRDWDANAKGGGLVFRGRSGTRTHPAPVLRGPFQMENAGIALACADMMAGVDLTDEARADGLMRADWPGRMQRLNDGRLVDLLSQDWELWLDGGHNEAAGHALAHAVGGWDDRPIHLIYGMLNTKAARDFLRPLAPLAETLHAVAIPGVVASLSAEEAAGEAAAAGLSARVSAGIRAAIAEIVREGRPGRILICGSLYLAGHVLAENHAPA